MKVHLRGIIQTQDEGHRHVHVVVTEDGPFVSQKHEVGIDIDVNRGRIITFLSGLYGVPPGEIDWPEHISAVTSES